MEETGIEVRDLAGFPEFGERRLHVRDVAQQMEGLRRLVRAFVEKPETILQELVGIAVTLCGADSAGISVEQGDGTDENYWFWVATSGMYEKFQNATLPRYPSACGICLERGKAQHFTVTQRFFDLMQVDAPVVTDRILLPWEVDGTRGTIWVMAHERTEAFDAGDSEMMQTLADFAAMAIRQKKQQETLLRQATAEAAARMANELAHQINNPLQSLTNLLYLATEGYGDVKALGLEASADLQRLSELVNKLLVLPLGTAETDR